MNTPRVVGSLRLQIIGKMISGEIPYHEAMRLQEMCSNIELIMAAGKYGINLLSSPERHSQGSGDRTATAKTDIQPNGLN